MSFTSISWFVKMFLGDSVSKNQRQSSILSDSRFLFFDIYNVAYIKVKPNSKKKSSAGTRNMTGKSIPEISNLEKIGISFQSYGAQQITFFYVFCVLGMGM